MEVIDACGMTVMIDSVPVRRDQRWETIIPPGIWFGIVLEGELSVRTDLVGDTAWGPGATTRFKTQQAVATLHHALKDCVISGVFVRVAPDHMETVMGGDALHLLQRCPTHVGRVSDLARTVAWQMRGCTLSGPARRLYLAGKALEMMGESFTGPGASSTTAPSGAWSARDIECFHAAHAILLAELADPPTVTALARRVGTNARKLSQGFADLFGAPVYRFVKALRLEEAKRMIEAGETSISRVAQSFGYQPAHFSTEFRRRFGHAPSALIGRNKKIRD
jgi:AraC family transcriptional regulator, transcriptional activator of the genes for pyochelin and ferripyochelin receptors